MSWRETLARRLCPKLARQADRERYLTINMQEMKWWVGQEFPQIEVALDYLNIGATNYFRPLDEKPISQEYPKLGGIWPSRIDGFREKLRTTFAPSGQLSSPHNKGSSNG